MYRICSRRTLSTCWLLMLSAVTIWAPPISSVTWCFTLTWYILNLISTFFVILYIMMNFASLIYPPWTHDFNYFGPILILLAALAYFENMFEKKHNFTTTYVYLLSVYIFNILTFRITSSNLLSSWTVVV